VSLKKKARQDVIRKLIKSKRIGTQVELIKELSKKGIKINQPTISRDLREMGVIKVAKGLGKIVYQLPSEIDQLSMDEFRHKIINLVTNIVYTQNFILVKTFPGEAQGVGKAIDNASLSYILGTVAGDDTILVVIDKEINVRKVLKIFDDIKQGLLKK
jgi:transcriptional regulator of arginine metabolism